MIIWYTEHMQWIQDGRAGKVLSPHSNLEILMASLVQVLFPGSDCNHSLICCGSLRGILDGFLKNIILVKPEKYRGRKFSGGQRWQ